MEYILQKKENIRYSRSEANILICGKQMGDPLEYKRDPYFGLDWTRNLAVTMMELGGKKVSREAADIRSSSFSRYIEDVGFPVSDLDKVLYELAVRKPGYFFFRFCKPGFRQGSGFKAAYSCCSFLPVY